MNLIDKTIAVVGLGYVGLPLAAAFGKSRSVIGFDIDHARINELLEGHDSTKECSFYELQKAKYLRFSADPSVLSEAQIFIVTVPTPVDKAKRPVMTPLINASIAVGKVLKKGDLVIYESTVFPGATEEICVPCLVKSSGLEFNKDFFCGYSPERINPGDKERRIADIVKITSGSTPEASDIVDQLYKEIISAGTHKTSSIKVAEAAKVIENTQRDINVALMNELSIIFHKLDIDSLEVLEAAATKWNFSAFRPGLVGGHCIGVDPYYLTHKAQEVGYHPKVILSGRHINDSMAKHVADQVIKLMIKKGFLINKSRVLVLGLTFKEDCPDLRNSKVFEVIACLEEYDINVEVYDPLVDPAEVEQQYGLTCLSSWPEARKYHGIIVAVGHSQFIDIGGDKIRSCGQPDAVLYDVKSVLPVKLVDGRL